MKLVTDFHYVDPTAALKAESSAEIDAEKKKEEDRKTPTSKEQKGRKTPNKAEAPTPNNDNKMEFPEFDKEEPNKHKVTPDCVNLNMPRITTMSEMLQFFILAQNLEEDQQFSLIIADSQNDSPQYTEIVDLAVGIGAQYLHLSGCNRIEKFAKVERFCEIKSQQLNDY